MDAAAGTCIDCDGAQRARTDASSTSAVASEHADAAPARNDKVCRRAVCCAALRAAAAAAACGAAANARAARTSAPALAEMLALHAGRKSTSCRPHGTRLSSSASSLRGCEGDRVTASGGAAHGAAPNAPAHVERTVRRRNTRGSADSGARSASAAAGRDIRARRYAFSRLSSSISIYKTSTRSKPRRCHQQ